MSFVSCLALLVNSFKLLIAENRLFAALRGKESGRKSLTKNLRWKEVSITFSILH